MDHGYNPDELIATQERLLQKYIDRCKKYIDRCERFEQALREIEDSDPLLTDEPRIIARAALRYEPKVSFGPMKPTCL